MHKRIIMKFSILIPAYKDRYFEECIDSCLAQTYTNFEIIIVNDNSPYNLDVIINNYHDQRIRYYKNEKGYGAEKIVDNWNHCLEYATGDYVICMGDDDKLKPNCLEDYSQLITIHPNLDVYHMRMEIINNNSEIVTIQEDRPETESAYSMIWHFWHGRKQVIGDWCFNTNSLKEYGGFVNLPYGWSSDNLTAFQLAQKKGTANARFPGFQYRESDITLTSKHSPNTITGKIKAWKMVKEWYVNFLHNNETTTEVDTIYKKEISELLERYINRKIEGEIESGIHSSPYSILTWLKVGRQSNIPNSTIVKTIIKSIL